MDRSGLSTVARVQILVELNCAYICHTLTSICNDLLTRILPVNISGLVVYASARLCRYLSPYYFDQCFNHFTISQLLLFCMFV